MYYDSKIIEKFARQLYREANCIIFKKIISWAFMFLLIGVGIAYLLLILTIPEVMKEIKNIQDVVLVFQEYYKTKDFTVAYVSMGVSTFFGAIIGYNIGEQIAFKLKLEAQVAMCQVQIERNTSA